MATQQREPSLPAIVSIHYLLVSCQPPYHLSYLILKYYLPPPSWYRGRWIRMALVTYQSLFSLLMSPISSSTISIINASFVISLFLSNDFIKFLTQRRPSHIIFVMYYLLSFYEKVSIYTVLVNCIFMSRIS